VAKSDKTDRPFWVLCYISYLAPAEGSLSSNTVLNETLLNSEFKRLQSFPASVPNQEMIASKSAQTRLAPDTTSRSEVG